MKQPDTAPMHEPAFQSRFLACWPDAISGAKRCAELLERYAEPSRHYHDARHILDCLAWVDDYTGRRPSPLQHEAELALFYHDAVSVPTRSDNEEKSAELFLTHASAAGFPPDGITRVVDAILATRRTAPAEGELSQLVCDADLAILGAERGTYECYAASVRLEYGHLPDWVYRRGRARFLSKLASQARLFALPFFFERLEQRARVNVASELALLTGKEGGV